MARGFGAERSSATCWVATRTPSPPSAAERLARRLAHVEVLRLDCGHFETYDGEEFEGVVAGQAGFLERLVA